MNIEQKVILNNIVSELEGFKKNDLDLVPSIISVKKMANRLEKESIVNLEQSFALEVYLIGILNLLKEKE